MEILCQQIFCWTWQLMVSKPDSCKYYFYKFSSANKRLPLINLSILFFYHFFLDIHTFPLFVTLKQKGLMPKIVSATSLLVCFACLKESTFETKKNVFFFYFESSFSSWDNQILTSLILKCQMPKHETRNTFYWITWEVNTTW